MGEMIFKYGFVHGDPHPGNVFVRQHPKTKECQVVLLDHGMYRELTEKTRIGYGRLYEALVLRNKEDSKKYALELGIRGNDTM